MNRKIVAVWISLVMIFSLIVILVKIAQNVEAPTIIYVDDDNVAGPWDGTPTNPYQYIQDGVDTATDGDTVFVFKGTYYENVMVNKTINLTGEDMDYVKIDGGGSGVTVNVSVNLVNVTGFTITGSGSSWWDAGIKLDGVQNCNISANNISSNERMGILLMRSSNNTISNNFVFENNRDGIHLESSSHNNLTNINISSNDWYGINLDSSHQNTISSCNISLNSQTALLMDLSNNNEIINSNMVNGWSGGVFLDSSSYNNFTNCEISNNDDGIEFYTFSNNNRVKYCNISSNDLRGVFFSESSNNTLTDSQIDFNTDGVGFSSPSVNNLVKNCSISNNNNDGIRIYEDNPDNNTIMNNTIDFNNRNGIFIFDSFNNTISENDISNNLYGLNISLSSGNKIYHNNIIHNTIQALDKTDSNIWNDTYPSGGNYWSDWTSPDAMSGLLQNTPGRDGIVDKPYVIDADSQDNYPLIEPIKNYIILYKGWNLISIPLIQEEQNLTRVLGSIDGWYDAVQWYNIKDTKDLWKHRRLGKPYANDLSELNETMGFWIHITQPGVTIFLYNGIQPTQNQTIQLYTGWNMVGYPSLTSYNRTVGLNNLTFDDQVDAIWSYDAATQKWVEMGESDLFIKGRGYYIHAKTKCEWEVPL